jgi:hypothetical protein
MLPSLAEYERLIYALPDRYPAIQQSTLVVVRRGPAFAELSGVVELAGGITLTVWEDLDFAEGVIQGYSYAVDQHGERLYWYDPQPHAGDPSLASSFPHHKHLPPGPSDSSGQSIKRHRVPAPNIRFDHPNLPALIEEIERDLLPS